MTEQTNAEATAAYFDLHRRHETLLAAVVGLRDCYRANAALHGRLGRGDEPFQHAAWANRADDLDNILTPSAAVREGERERLAAAWDYGWRAGWDDREGGDGQVTPNAYWPNDAAPSLAAPEGTEQ